MPIDKVSRQELLDWYFELRDKNVGIGDRTGIMQTYALMQIVFYLRELAEKD